MKETVKDLAKSTMISIGMSLTIFCIMGMVADIISEGNFSINGSFNNSIF